MHAALKLLQCLGAVKFKSANVDLPTSQIACPPPELGHVEPFFVSNEGFSTPVRLRDLGRDLGKDLVLDRGSGCE